MKQILFLIPAFLLLLSGCSNEVKEEKVQQPVKKVAVNDGSTSGIDTNSGQNANAFAGNPLNDPNSLLAERVIYFAYDSTDVAPRYADVVAAHAAYIASNPNVKLTLEGHADERGSREYNIALGENRAKALSGIMVLQGADDAQMDLVSYGEERPVADGHTDASWAQNRRVEIVY